MPVLPAPTTSATDADKLAALAPQLIGKKFPSASDQTVATATVASDSKGTPYISVQDVQGGIFELYADGSTVYVGKEKPGTHIIDPGPQGVFTLTGVPKWFDYLYPGAGSIDKAIESADQLTHQDLLGNLKSKVTSGITALPDEIASAVASALKGLISTPFFIRVGEALLGVLILIVAFAIFFKGEIPKL